MPDDSPIQSRVPIQKSVPTWADEKEPSADALVAPKFANFTKYVPGEGRTKCQALFVPSGVSVPNNKMVDLVGKTWRLPMPNLLIACDAGMAHPSGLAAGRADRRASLRRCAAVEPACLEGPAAAGDLVWTRHAHAHARAAPPQLVHSRDPTLPGRQRRRRWCDRLECCDAAKHRWRRRSSRGGRGRRRNERG